jgi:hypothetical protein
LIPVKDLDDPDYHQSRAIAAEKKDDKSGNVDFFLKRHGL